MKTWKVFRDATRVHTADTCPYVPADHEVAIRPIEAPIETPPEQPKVPYRTFRDDVYHLNRRVGQLELDRSEDRVRLKVLEEKLSSMRFKLFPKEDIS